MKLLATALLALTLAVVAGSIVANDPGFIVIGFGGKVVRTTFAFFMLASVALGIVLYGLLRGLANLFELRRRWRRWSEEYRRRRAHRSLASGMLALAKGEFARAERLFSRGVDEDAQPEVHYLAAAEAAQALKASARRDNYLRLAHDVQPDAADAIDIKRAQWLIENDQLIEARGFIDRLQGAQERNPQVLKLRMDLLRRSGDMRALLELIPDLRRDRVMPFDDINALERDCAIAVLNEPRETLEVLHTLWKGMSKPMRKSPQVLGRYVQGLCAVGAGDEAEVLLRKQLESAWDSSLAALYGEIECEPPARQLRKADGWAVTRSDDPGLTLTRARLSIRAGLWGQAKDHLERLISVAPSPVLYRLQAEAADGMGNSEVAAALRKSGLELATGIDASVPRRTQDDAA